MTRAASSQGYPATVEKIRATLLKIWLVKRKINSNESGFPVTMQAHITGLNSNMMRIVENVHATYPPFAMIVPILMNMTLLESAGRGDTLNDGAADATGR